MYVYDPKWKRILPYYDIFPCMIPIHFYKDGWLGINMHYLPLPLRAKLMDALYTIANNKRFDESTKLKISYGLLKSAAKFKWFRPCIKRYLSKHVRSRFFNVVSAEWDIGLFLPVARFKKASQEKVWKDSRDIINRYDKRGKRKKAKVAVKKKTRR